MTKEVVFAHNISNESDCLGFLFFLIRLSFLFMKKTIFCFKFYYFNKEGAELN